LQQFLHSPAERGFQYVIGSTALREALNNYADKPKYQRLVIDFEYGEDPDDAYSSIPYEKGSNFLLYLGMFISHAHNVRFLIGHQNKHLAA
jgi:leukotriene-A4 hydrolase